MFWYTPAKRAAEQRLTCYRCHRHFGGNAATVEEVFGRNGKGEPYSRCRPCRQRHNEVGKAFYIRHREACIANSNAYREAQRHTAAKSTNNGARKYLANFCGRMSMREHMKRHQAGGLSKENICTFLHEISGKTTSTTSVLVCLIYQANKNNLYFFA